MQIRSRFHRARVDVTLADGAECWIEGKAYYVIDDPAKAFVWRREHRLPLDTIENIRSDYPEPGKLMSRRFREVMASMSTEDIRNRRFRDHVEHIRFRYKGTSLDDGTWVQHIGLRSTNCPLVAHGGAFPVPQPPAAPPVDACEGRYAFPDPIILNDRVWRNGEPASLTAIPKDQTEVVTKDHGRLRTGFPRIGIRPKSKLSWQALTGKNERDARQVVDAFFSFTMRELASRVNAAEYPAALNALALDEVAEELDAELHSIGIVVAEIAFDGVALQPVKRICVNK